MRYIQDKEAIINSFHTVQRNLNAKSHCNLHTVCEMENSVDELCLRCKKFTIDYIQIYICTVCVLKKVYVDHSSVVKGDVGPFLLQCLNIV